MAYETNRAPGASPGALFVNGIRFGAAPPKRWVSRAGVSCPKTFVSANCLDYWWHVAASAKPFAKAVPRAKSKPEWRKLAEVSWQVHL